MTERTLYVHRKLLNAADLIAWAKAQGFKTTLPAEDMHVTVARSKAPMVWPKPRTDQHEVRYSFGRAVKPLGTDGAITLRFDSPELAQEWAAFRVQGASWDYPTYQPHVTITYDAAGVDVGAVDPYKGPLVFGPEVFEEITPNWSANITEKSMSALDAKMIAEAVAIGVATALSKSQPAVGDVHVAGGDGKKRKPFAEALLDDGEATTTYQDTAKGFDVQTSFVIEKMDPAQQMVFGWASTSMIDGRLVVDKQDDAIEIHVLEKAGYDFVLNSRDQGDMHTAMKVGRLVESLVFTPEKAALGLVAKNEKGEQIFGWWTGFKVDDANLWDKHKRGERPEFSIGGRARSVAV